MTVALSPESKLRVFEVEELEDEGLRLTCPHCLSECDVDQSWKTSSDYQTRSCTYCFKTSKVPE